MTEMSASDVIERLRTAVTASSVAVFAREHELSASYVGDVLAGRRHPGPAICKALGLEVVTIYRHAASEPFGEVGASRDEAPKERSREGPR
jgi:hypothetical protein